jgi:hypothetical protein
MAGNLPFADNELVTFQQPGSEGKSQDGGAIVGVELRPVSELPDQRVQ